MVRHDRDPIAGQAVAANFSAFTAVDLVGGDITLEETSQAKAGDAYKQLDILVNNAANFARKSVEDAAVSDWQRVLGVKATGTTLVARYVQPNLASYNSSKGAVCQGCFFTSASEREISQRGLTVAEWTAPVAPRHMLRRLAYYGASLITGESLMVGAGYVQW